MWYLVGGLIVVLGGGALIYYLDLGGAQPVCYGQ